jgi:hypothetical protein
MAGAGVCPCLHLLQLIEGHVEGDGILRTALPVCTLHTYKWHTKGKILLIEIGGNTRCQ